MSQRMRQMVVLITSLMLVVTAHWAIAQSATPAASARDVSTIATAVYGELNRLRLAEGVEIAGQYPSEELRRQKIGHADVRFAIGIDGHVAEMAPTGVRTSDAFYQAAQGTLLNLRFSRLDASAPDTRYNADVTFTLPPCIAKSPGRNAEVAITICASHDRDIALQWDQPWPPGPVYPATYNRALQGNQARGLQFEGEWQGTKGATEFVAGAIKSDGASLGEYSIVAHEEFVVVLEITSALYSAKYWRLDAIDYTRCQVARDGLDCARPYEPATRLVLTMYEDLDDALAFSREYSGRIHYLSFRKSP